MRTLMTVITLAMVLAMSTLQHSLSMKGTPEYEYAFSKASTPVRFHEGMICQILIAQHAATLFV